MGRGAAPRRGERRRGVFLRRASRRGSSWRVSGDGGGGLGLSPAGADGRSRGDARRGEATPGCARGGRVLAARLVPLRARPRRIVGLGRDGGVVGGGERQLADGGDVRRPGRLTLLDRHGVGWRWRQFQRFIRRRPPFRPRTRAEDVPRDRCGRGAAGRGPALQAHRDGRFGEPSAVRALGGQRSHGARAALTMDSYACHILLLSRVREFGPRCSKLDPEPADLPALRLPFSVKLPRPLRER